MYTECKRESKVEYSALTQCSSIGKNYFTRIYENLFNIVWYKTRQQQDITSTSNWTNRLKNLDVSWHIAVCLSTWTPKIINFSFIPKWKVIILGVLEFSLTAAVCARSYIHSISKIRNPVKNSIFFSWQNFIQKQNYKMSTDGWLNLRAIFKVESSSIFASLGYKNHMDSGLLIKVGGLNMYVSKRKESLNFFAPIEDGHLMIICLDSLTIKS